MKMTSYLVRTQSGQLICFSKDPKRRGRWVRTHPSVSLTPCPHCGAKQHEPCIGSQGHGAFTHYQRRNEARGYRHKRVILGDYHPLAALELKL